MARLTLYPPRGYAYKSDPQPWYNTSYFHSAPMISKAATSEDGEDNTVYHVGVTLTDLRVHSLAIQWVEVGFFPEEKETSRPLPFYAVVLQPGEEQRVADLLPIGYVLRSFEVTDSPADHYCIRICETYIQNEVSRHGLRFDDLHFTPDRFDAMDKAVASFVRDLRKVQELMPVVFDIRSPDDKVVILTEAAMNSVPSYSQTHRVDGVRIRDSMYPFLTHVKLEKKYEAKTVGWHIDISEKGADLVKSQGIEVVAAFDDSLSKSAVERANKALGVGRPSFGAEKPKSGRRVVIDEPLPQFPLATRCSIGTQSMLVFGIDADRGTYRAVDGANPAFGDDLWPRRDFMLIHRDRDCWRFLFWNYIQLHTRIFIEPRAVMLMPYVVDDTECSVAPKFLSPQRGMPPAISTAIAKTPYCAAAISHGLSRLRFARTRIAALHKPMGKNADLHHPEFGMLFRSEPGSTRIEGTKKRNYDTTKLRPSDALKTAEHLLNNLPENRIEWEAMEKTPMSALLGAAAHRPRAVVLDM